MASSSCPLPPGPLRAAWQGGGTAPLFLWFRPGGEPVGQPADGQGDQHVQHRMLLEEHRRKGDEDGRRRKGGPPAGGAKVLAVPGADQDGHRGDHMERWADVGVGVEKIEARHKAGDDIVPLKDHRAQLLAVGKDHKQDDCNGVGEAA